MGVIWNQMDLPNHPNALGIGRRIKRLIVQSFLVWLKGCLSCSVETMWICENYECSCFQGLATYTPGVRDGQNISYHKKAFLWYKIHVTIYHCQQYNTVAFTFVNKMKCFLYFLYLKNLFHWKHHWKGLNHFTTSNNKLSVCNFFKCIKIYQRYWYYNTLLIIHITSLMRPHDKMHCSTLTVSLSSYRQILNFSASCLLSRPAVDFGIGAGNWTCPTSNHALAYLNNNNKFFCEEHKSMTCFSTPVSSSLLFWFSWCIVIGYGYSFFEHLCCGKFVICLYRVIS